MKPFHILTIALLFICLFPASAQIPIGGVRISEPFIDKVDELVTVDFTAATGKKTVRRNHSILLVPAITDGTYTWSLPAIIITGRGANISLDRRILASGREVDFENVRFGRPGQTVHYTASVPYQQWMDGAALNLEAMLAGCCSASAIASEVMVEELKLQPTVQEYAAAHQPQVTVPPVVVPESVTTGGKLTESYTFIANARDYRPVEPGQLYIDDREGTIQIHYAVGSHIIDSSLSGNEQALADIRASVRMLENSVDSRVKMIRIAGFSSPEGDAAYNDRLAWRRADAMQQYIMKHSSLDAGQFEIYNGSIDWQGLLMLIEQSDVSWKQKAIDIIENTPVWDSRRGVGRHGELMRLERGDPYRFMKQHWFPKLRNAAYIKLFYEDKQTAQP